MKPGKVAIPPNAVIEDVSDTPIGDELAESDAGVAAQAARGALDAGLDRLHALLTEPGQETDSHGQEDTATAGGAGNHRAREEPQGDSRVGVDEARR